ncbi:hypothetical protein RIF29_08215 [Crotalaria pallida]|uniref:Uncharacterized protein n=1 Tax=Crotalaria pallida TaxID=3830 RepID=A0AAN9J552_CROPI
MQAELATAMEKKDEVINHLRSHLQEARRELIIMRGTLSQVTVLKKKIETLDEDILLKEGQITILKDWLGKKSP